jgi:REP element-mobilizing transposase RayT
MAFVKVYVQFVWKTKNKISFLTIKEIRKIIWNHIRENAHKKGIRVDFINGYSNYYQCLIALEVDQTMDKVIETLKGEKTFWINKKGFSTELAPAELPPILDTKNNNYKWQDHYFAVAISESVSDRAPFIQNQLKNDDGKKIVNNYNEYLIQYGFQKFAGK